MRQTLVRGLLCGAAGGLLAFVFAYLVGEPAIEGAIHFEEMHSAATGHGEEPLVSRGVQSTLGLGVGTLVFGVAMGGLFAIAYAVARGRWAPISGRATALVLALLAFVSVTLVPFAVYPANPPAVGSHESLDYRTSLAAAMIVASVSAAVIAAFLARRLARSYGWWSATLVCALGYLIVVIAVAAVLPPVNGIPEGFPPAVLWQFRVASLGTNAVLWATIGLLFGAVVGRDERLVRARQERLAALG